MCDVVADTAHDPVPEEGENARVISPHAVRIDDDLPVRLAETAPQADTLHENILAVRKI